MGYRYYYSMNVDNIREDDADIISEILRKHSSYEPECTISHNGYYFQLSDVSWDEPNQAMKEISEQYPDTVFEMIFEGDSWDDRGSVYAKNGKTQTCMMIVSYEEPDEFFK
jgi:hypothetical protein